LTIHFIKKMTKKEEMSRPVQQWRPTYVETVVTPSSKRQPGTYANGWKMEMWAVTALYKEVYKNMQKRATQLKTTSFFIKSSAFPLHCSFTLKTSSQKKTCHSNNWQRVY
jgi:hypothetical protein